MFHFEDPSHFSLIVQRLGFNLLRTRFYGYQKRFAKKNHLKNKLEKSNTYKNTELKGPKKFDIVIFILQNALKTFYNLYYDYCAKKWIFHIKIKWEKSNTESKVLDCFYIVIFIFIVQNALNTF